MKYLDRINKKDIKSMAKHRLGRCPYPDDCYAVSYHVDKREAGHCSGIIHSSTNLDCIRLCVFYEDLEKHKVGCLEHYMTPDEAATTAHSLSLAIKASYDYNTMYQRYYKALDKARKDGDKTP